MDTITRTLNRDDNDNTSNATGPEVVGSRKKQVSVRRILSRVLKPIRNCKAKRINVIDQLLENDEEFSVLKLDGSHTGLNWERLIKAIQGNSTVKNVEINGGMVANMPLEEQLLLWEAIGGLPKLEEVHFKYFLEFPLMLESLNAVLIFATKLKKLTVYDSVFYSRDQNAKVTSLAEHENLKGIFLSQLRIPEGRVLDPIVAAFAEAPNLTNLTIRVPRKKRNMLRSETLSLLMSAPALKVLEMRRIVLQDEQIIQMAEELQQSTQFKEVTIQCDDCLREKCCVALGDMLSLNKSITRLEVWGQKVEEDGFCYVIDSLQENNTLKVLHLSHDIAEAGNTALARMLEHNYVMETLYMRSFGDPNMMARTDYFLKLNATGLRGLQLDVNMDRSLLVEKLGKHMDDINHTYYLLRGNPNFLNASEVFSSPSKDECQSIGVKESSVRNAIEC